jgi:hypothetical protein
MTWSFFFRSQLIIVHPVTTCSYAVFIVTQKSTKRYTEIGFHWGTCCYVDFTLHYIWWWLWHLIYFSFLNLGLTCFNFHVCILYVQCRHNNMHYHYLNTHCPLRSLCACWWFSVFFYFHRKITLIVCIEE